MTNLECHNFSTSFKCTAAHIAVLANGVKFVPTPPTMPPLALAREIRRFENAVSRVTIFEDGIFVNNNDGSSNNPGGDQNQARDANEDVSSNNNKKTMPALYRATGSSAISELWRKQPNTPLVQHTKWFLDQFKHTMECLGQDRLCNRNWLRSLPRTAFYRSPSNKHLRHVNLTKAERAALAELREATRFTKDPATNTYKPPRIVVCNADKNLGLTIVDYDWFHKECVRQLGDEKYYRVLRTETALTRIHGAFARLTNWVSDHTAKNSPAYKFLLSRPPTHKDHRTPSFYVIPKVHKPKLVGRPITPAHRFMFGPACDFITKTLHPIASLVPEILRDSTQLVLELDEIGEHRALPELYPHEEIYLVTGDVESLYTNIPRDVCFSLLRLLPIPAVALELLAMVFDHAIVRFDRTYYVQHEGFPMGISPAPDVANLFMWLLIRQGIGPPPAALLLYRRLIDDLFIIWRGDRAQLDAYLNSMNRLHKNIRITWTVSRTSVAFLDLEIHTRGRFQDNDGRLAINVHQKQLNRYLFIPQLSFHTEAQHRAWIKAELLRFLRNTTSAIDYKRMRAKFVERLFARGFNRKLIRAACRFYENDHEKRDGILSRHQKKQDKAYEKALQLVDAYRNPRLPPLPPEQTLHGQWLKWRANVANQLLHVSRGGTPWLAVESLLLSEDLCSAVRNTALDHLFGLFRRPAPLLAFFLPLTRETARLRWGDITLTLTRREKDGAPTWRLKPILFVLRRPPPLGLLLRFKNPEHDAPEPPKAS